MSNVKTRETANGDKSLVVDGNTRSAPLQQIRNTGRQPHEKGEQASSLMERITYESTLEVDRLIDDLKTLRGRLEDDGDRVQRDIAAHSSLSQSVIQLTKIVSESMAHIKVSEGAAHVKKISDAPRTDMEASIPAFLSTAIDRQ